ncbi:hypothetical protein [Nigerium massiliense]|uniref:hypothetical protein n=1 Tax=Nigerium massiliense TaxID=1522317 RepID=UPI000694C5C5|nr:hypothetical protein [Nigerium massiliense]
MAPPRVSADLAGRKLTFTCGAVPGDWLGYRSYVAPGASDDEQVIVVSDEATGAVRRLAVGASLGPRRVGAIGAVALEALAPDDPGAIAVIGTGRQAWHQLWALPKRFRDVPVRAFSRTASARQDFAGRARDELGLAARAAGSVAEAVRDAGVVILATSSPQPVLRPDDVRSSAYVTTLGPKQVGRSEFAPDLARDAALVVTDAPDQIRAYDPPNVLAGTPVEDALVHLGAVVAGEREVRAGTRVFFSAGLAGTEAVLLNALA